MCNYSPQFICRRICIILLFVVGVICVLGGVSFMQNDDMPSAYGGFGAGGALILSSICICYCCPVDNELGGKYYGF